MTRFQAKCTLVWIVTWNSALQVSLVALLVPLAGLAVGLYLIHRQQLPEDKFHLGEES